MSLQVWLPLNGDLHNQGLSPITSITNTPVYKTPGKISNSALNLSTRITFTCPALENLKTFSIAFWGIAQNSDTLTTNWQDLMGFTDVSSGGTTGTFRWETTYASSSGIHWHDNTTNALVNGSHNHITVKEQWVHCCVVFDNIAGKIYSYDNGVLTQTHTHAGGSFNTTGTFYLGETNNIEGMIQDVRIYDHALSEKEVEEIAKGLVLHYKLDNNGCGNENLYTGSYDFSGTWVNKVHWTDDTNTYHGFLVKKRSSAWGGLAQNITCSLNDIFTISFWAKVDSGGNIQSIHRSNLGNVTTGLTILGGNFSSSTIWVQNAENGMQWKRYWATVQIISSDITYLQWRIENSVADKNLYICGFKLEKGTVATSWCPAKTDALYSLYATNDTTVYDSSGYGNNGTIVGSLETATPSPRYSCAMKFNGNTSCIKIPYNEINPDRIFTVNLWFHKDALGSKTCETLFGGPSGFEMDTRAGASTTLSLYMASVRGGNAFSPFNLNEWYMVTMVRNGTNEMYYINGELKKTIEAKSMPSGQYRIGAWASDTGQNYYGDMSDFRIYATALTPEQIKELYNTSMSIDNNGNIHARELVEL